MPRFATKLVISTLFIDCLLFRCTAQEKQSIFLSPTYTSLEGAPPTHRTNVCSRQEGISLGVRDMRRALDGLKLSFSVPDAMLRNYINFESRDPYIIDSKNPGFLALVMDEVAQRAGFTWRDSFHVFKIPQNISYTDALGNLADQVDVVADYWIHLTERLEHGITFPEGYWDTSLIIVGRDEGESESLHLLSWAHPFSNPVWGLIVVALLFTTVAFWVLERSEPDSDLDGRASVVPGLGISLYLAGSSFTGGGGYTPKSFAGRLLTISWTFCCLLLTATYTANLASFLVVSKHPQFSVESMEEANRLGVPVCVFGGTGEETMAREAYPSVNWVPIPDEPSMFAAVNSGRCILAVTSVDSWTSWEHNKVVNGNCTLRWIGRAFRAAEAGVAVMSDAGILCTSLVRDVLDLHFKDMKADGSLARFKEDYFGSTDSRCTQTELEGWIQNRQLGAEGMGGVFLFHGVVGVIALVIRGLHVFMGRETGTQPNTPAPASHPDSENKDALEVRVDINSADRRPEFERVDGAPFGPLKPHSRPSSVEMRCSGQSAAMALAVLQQLREMEERWLERQQLADQQMQLQLQLIQQLMARQAPAAPGAGCTTAAHERPLGGETPGSDVAPVAQLQPCAQTPPAEGGLASRHETPSSGQLNRLGIN